MTACGLGVKNEHETVVPVLQRVVCTEAADRLVIRILRGHNPEDYQRAALDLAYAFGARTARVYETRPDARPMRVSRHRWLRPFMWVLRQVDAWRWADRSGQVHLVIARRDPLTAIVRPLPIDPVVDLTSLPLAVTSTLEVFRFCLIATHLLIVGASRRGKGSVIWSLLSALAPAIHTGLVRVWAIDPKGGMELGLGQPLFSRFAYQSFASMADLLEEAVAIMNDRQERLAGVVRVHTPQLGRAADRRAH
jgi:S-DNA-T family DNA segregation ATPase FtsK/SpoIIIE